MKQANFRTVHKDVKVLADRYLEKEFNSIYELFDDIEKTDFEIIADDCDGKEHVLHLWNKTRTIKNGWNDYMIYCHTNENGKTVVIEVY